LELLTGSEEVYPVDAAAVRAVYHRHAGNTSEAVEALDRFYTQLLENPWVIPYISEAACFQTDEVAKGNPDAAQRLYRLLAKPFASARFDYIRKLTRVKVAQEIGPELVVEALSDLEPHITWAQEILEPRAKAYAAVNHPRAKQAQRDWQWFQDHQTAK
jgi:hypothetical protein